MKIVFFLLAPLALVSPLSAQIRATVTASREGSVIKIANREILPLTAIALRIEWKLRGDWPPAIGDMAKVPAKIYLDSLIDPSATPLAPNEQRNLDRRDLVFKRPAGPRVAFAEPIDAAGIFADGSTTGDQSLLTLLLLRRSNMLLAADTAIEILSDAAKHNVPPVWLNNQFRRLSLSHFYLLPEQEAGHAVYESILAKLVNLPQDAFRAGR